MQILQNQMQDLNFQEEEDKDNLEEEVSLSPLEDSVVEVPTVAEPVQVEELMGSQSDDKLIGGEGDDTLSPLVDATTIPETPLTATSKSFEQRLLDLNREKQAELAEEEEDSENTVGFIDRTVTSSVNLVKNLVYGAGRKGILATAELAAEAPLFASKTVHGQVLTRSIEEAAKVAFKGLAMATEYVSGAKNEEHQIFLSNLYGYITFAGDRHAPDKNLLDYVDILDNFTELDSFYDRTIKGGINSGVDFVTAGNVTNLITTTDDKGNKVEGDYSKYADYLFKAYEVPPEEQNFVGRVVQTGAELMVPLSAYKLAGKGLQETTEGLIQKYTTAQTKTAEQLKGITAKRTGKGIPADVKKSRYEKSLEVSLDNIGKKIDDLAFHQRHYSTGLVAASLNNQTNRLGLSSEAVAVLKQEGNVALMASTAMVTTEVLLEKSGLEEYKPFAMLSGLAGGMLGVKGAVNGLTTAKDWLLYAIKRNNVNDGGAKYDPILRIRGYDQASINNMDERRKTEIATTDPRTMKMARRVGEIIAELQTSNPEMYRKIVTGIKYSRELTEKFSKDLLKDVDDGIIKKEDFGYLNESLPLLLDQVAMLTGLHKLKDTLISNISNSGLTMKTERFVTISELDNLTNFLQKQSETIRLNLENVEKRIKKESGIEGSFSATLIKNMTEFTSDYSSTSILAKQELDRLKQIPENEINPIHQKDYQTDMENFFGEDTFNLEIIKRQNKDTNPNMTSQQASSIAARNKEAFGDSQKDLIDQSYKDIQEQVNIKYDEVEDFSVPIDELFRDNRFMDTLLESSDALGVYAKELPGATNRLESLVRAGRTSGLARLRTQFNTDQQGEYIDTLVHLDIQHDTAMGNTRTTQEMIDYKQELSEAIQSKGYKEVIKDLEKELIAKDVTQFDDKGNSILIGDTLINSKGVESQQSIIPMYMSFKDLELIKRRTMDNAFVRNPNTGGKTKQGNKRAEANLFVHAIDNSVDEFIKRQGLTKLGLTQNSSEKLKEAREFYKKTLGATFKRRMGIELKEQADNPAIETRDSIPNDSLFEEFLTQKDVKRSAEVFKTMFSDIDDKGNVLPNTLNPEARALLLQSARRLVLGAEGKQRGLKSLNRDIIEYFFNDVNGPNLYKNIDQKNIDKFEGWKTAENNYINTSGFKNVFEAQGYVTTLKSAIDTLSSNRQDILKRSLFGNIRPESGDLDFDSIFKQTELFHAADEPLEAYFKRANDRNDSYTLQQYNQLRNNIETVDSLQAKELLPETSEIGLISESVGPVRREGANTPQNSVRVIIDAFENQPEKQKDVIYALRGLYVKHIMSDAYKLTGSKAYRQRNVIDAVDDVANASPFKLVRDVDLASFSEMLYKESNLKMMDDLWNSGGEGVRDPAQVERLRRIYELEKITKGEMPQQGTNFSAVKPMQINSLISRVYSISRGVVSPKYVASEIYITQAQIRKGNFMLKMLTDPNITITIEEAMGVASGDIATSPAFLKSFEKMAIALFVTEMGETSDSSGIKSRAYLKEQFEFLGNFIKETSIELEFGSSEKDSVSTPPSEEEPFIFGEMPSEEEASRRLTQ